MTKVIYITLLVLLILVVIGNIFTYPMQHLFIFRPDVIEKNYRFSFDNEFEEVNIMTEDGGNINALHFKRPNSKGVVLYFHGNSGNLIRWGELNDEFGRMDYDLFIMDFRGFGKSTGELTESTFYQDAELCYQYVSERYESQDIIIYGRSMGSGPASYLASKVDARHLVLETPFYSIKSLFYTYYPFLPRVFVFKYRFPNFKYLKAVSYPITIFHGTNDFIVPYRGSRKLKEIIKPSDDYIALEGGTHNDLMIFGEYQEKLKEILN
ncbi:MAG: alpha/beta fold hydrolase [Flavobacteriales bacterium]|nr:alpha/beta fold hydrolase [Flavobacteriales bacterium]